LRISQNATSDQASQLAGATVLKILLSEINLSLIKNAIDHLLLIRKMVLNQEIANSLVLGNYRISDL
jgi:hypothetical protein